MKFFSLLAIYGLVAASLGQAPSTPNAPAKQNKKPDGPMPIVVDSRAITQAELQGVEVRLKDIARFRGIRPNQIMGVGLVMGLEGTGDKTPMTQTLLSNFLKEWGTSISPANLGAKNVAIVLITAELPAFAKPGTTIDVRVSSIGDAKSLQGGTLIQTPLYAAGDKERAYAVAEGAVSIGGFNAGSGGASVQRNHVLVGRIPNGAIVESAVPTKMVFGGQMFLELYSPDLTTASRVATGINNRYPDFKATPIDGGTIELSLPSGLTTVDAMSKLEAIKVFADVEAKVVINERTGTIVIGGNVRLAPAAIAHGSLNIKIESDPIISQPAPFSQGTTTVVNQTTVKADQDSAKVAVIPANTTIADLARILQALQLKPTEIISIVQALAQQGALKAKVELQ